MSGCIVCQSKNMPVVAATELLVIKHPLGTTFRYACCAAHAVEVAAELHRLRPKSTVTRREIEAADV